MLRGKTRRLVERCYPEPETNTLPAEDFAEKSNETPDRWFVEKLVVLVRGENRRFDRDFAEMHRCFVGKIESYYLLRPPPKGFLSTSQ